MGQSRSARPCTVHCKVVSSCSDTSKRLETTHPVETCLVEGDSAMPAVPMSFKVFIETNQKLVA